MCWAHNLRDIKYHGGESSTLSQHQTHHFQTIASPNFHCHFFWVAPSKVFQSCMPLSTSDSTAQVMWCLKDASSWNFFFLFALICSATVLQTQLG